jgi:hypothetical protein
MRGTLDLKTTIEIVKNAFEIAAYLAALAFSLYKVCSGYFIGDVSWSIQRPLGAMAG